jgi:hypothetical protein
MLSITRTSTGSFVGSSFRPSCSMDCDEEVRRVRIGGRRVRSGASAWVAKVSSQSQLPARLARSMTYRPDGPMNAFTNAEGNHLLTFYRSSATVA